MRGERELIEHASVPDFAPGAEIEVGHPFVREAVSLPSVDPDGSASKEVMSWRPGTRAKMTAPDDATDVCDAMGSQILTVVSLHRPGKYPTRVFYTRKWKDPEGKEFGRPALRIASLAAFRKIIGGYRWPFQVEAGEAKQIEAAQ